MCKAGVVFGQLAEAGVHPGTRVCVHADRRGLTRFGDFVGFQLFAGRSRPATSPGNPVSSSTDGCTTT